MIKNNLFEETDLFSATAETPATSPQEESPKQETAPAAVENTAPEKKTRKARTPKKESQGAETAAETAPKEKETPKEDRGPKQIDLEGLVESLRKNGEARLSDHVIKPKAEDEEPQEEDPEEDPEEDDAEEGTEAKEISTPAPAARTVSKAKKKILSLPEEERIVADGLGKYLKEYLDNRAKQDPVFAKAYANPEKSLKECILYISGEVFRTKMNGKTAQVSNKLVEGMALHYYQEPDVKPTGNRDNIAFAVMSEIEPLSEEDKRKISRMALEEVSEEYLESEKKRIRQEIIEGKRKVQYTPEQMKAIDAAAREQMVEESKKRQKRLSTKKSSAPAPTIEQVSLF